MCDIEITMCNSSYEMTLQERKMRKIEPRQRPKSAPPGFLRKPNNNFSRIAEIPPLKRSSSLGNWIGIPHSTERVQRIEDTFENSSDVDNSLDIFQNDEDYAREITHDSKLQTGKEWLELFRVTCGRIVSSLCFQSTMIVLIILNAIMMAIGTFDFVTENPDVLSKFERIDNVFLIIFTSELIMQITYYGFSFFIDGWLVFDFVIILVSWGLSSLQIIRAFRIFRALRLITRVGELRILVAALINVMPRMFSISLLLTLIFYIYAVMCTVLFKEISRNGQLEDDYFSSLGKSYFTLLQMMTMEWSEISRDCEKAHSFAPAIFTTFVMITGFIVYNLIIAVICDAVKVSDNQYDKVGEVVASFKFETNREQIHRGQTEIDLRNQINTLLQNQREIQLISQKLVKVCQERETKKLIKRRSTEIQPSYSSGLKRTWSPNDVSGMMQTQPGLHSDLMFSSSTQSQKMTEKNSSSIIPI